MKTVAISQRVVVEPSHGERRDCLDQAWTRFLARIMHGRLANVA